MWPASSVTMRSMEVNLTVGKLSSSRMVPLAVPWDTPARVGLLMVTVKVSSPSYLLLVSLWPSSKVGTVMVVDVLPAVMVPVPSVCVKSPVSELSSDFLLVV